MVDSLWFWIAVAPVALESLVLFVRPTWLSSFAFFGEQERRITLRSRRRDPEPLAGYRDMGRSLAELPTLPARTDLSDSVLFTGGPRIALRRAFGLGRRQIWLVEIAIERSDEEIVLRAKQAFVPITLPLFTGAMMAMMSTRGHMPFPQILMVPAIMIAVFALQHVFSRSSRNQGIEEAFDFIEAELRSALEERFEARRQSPR